MRASYPARYHDDSGDLDGVIENDGRTLRLKLGAVEFSGTDFDGLEPTQRDSLPERFTLDRERDLCHCALDFAIPHAVLTGTGREEGFLHVHLELGKPRVTGGLDHELVRLELRVGERRFASRGASGWFEDELDDVQRALPSGWHLHSCYGCAYSDYSPAGHGLFGGLACFRGNKSGYLAVEDKVDLFKVWPTLTESVQETYVCPEFDRRRPRAGYRGYPGLESSRREP